MRYTKQWLKWFVDFLDFEGYQYVVVEGELLRDYIKYGDVLDAYGTNYWKMTQLAKLVKLMDSGDVGKGDVIIDFDIWHPGIEILPYIFAITKNRVPYFGILHAGTYDITDFTYRYGMRNWGHKLEESWFSWIDGIFLGSWYHYDMVMRVFGDIVEGKLHVTGLPLKISDIREVVSERHNENRQNEIVFTARLAPEKDFPKALKISELSGFPIYSTQEHQLSKDEYYRKLASCKISLSTARHENFGIGIIESMCLGTVPVVSDGLSYVDYVPSSLRYRDVDEAVDLVKHYMSYEWFVGEDKFGLVEYVKKYEDSIRRMVEIAASSV